MDNVDSMSDSIATCLSLFYLCQFEPVSVYLKWLGKHTRRPTKGIISVNRNDSSFFVRELVVSHQHADGVSVSRYNRFRINPSEWLWSPAHSVSVAVLDCVGDDVLTRGVDDWTAAGALTATEMASLLDRNRIHHLRTLWASCRDRLRATSRDLVQDLTARGIVTATGELHDRDGRAAYWSHALWTEMATLGYDRAVLTAVNPHTEADITAFLGFGAPPPSAQNADVGRRLGALERQMDALRRMAEEECADTQEIRRLIEEGALRQPQTTTPLATHKKDAPPPLLKKKTDFVSHTVVTATKKGKRGGGGGRGRKRF